MGLLGTGAPAFILGQTLYKMPSPAKGSRDEKYIDETEGITNVYGTKIKFEKQLRWQAKYLWPIPDSEVYDVLVAVFNASRQIMWIPHIDVPFIRYLVDIEKPPKRILAKGDVRFDNLEVEVVAVHLTNKVPSIDNMLTGFSPFSVAMLKRS